VQEDVGDPGEGEDQDVCYVADVELFLIGLRMGKGELLDLWGCECFA
jgi:hypothetical protein